MLKHSNEDALVEAHENNFDRLTNNINELYKLVREHTTNYYKTDKPLIDTHERFINNLVKAMWIVFTPIIAGIGLSLIIIGFETWQGHSKKEYIKSNPTIEKKIQ